jgi:primosomal protein N' (replication factor Y)
VLVQTRVPEHHALVCAAHHDTEAFLRQELQNRASPAYPPHVALLNAIVSGEDEQAVSLAATHFADWADGVCQQHGLPLELLGPAPCPVVRLRERWRWHVLVRGEGRTLGRFVRAAARVALRHREPRIVLDRDPVTLL